MSTNDKCNAFVAETFTHYAKVYETGELSMVRKKIVAMFGLERRENLLLKGKSLFLFLIMKKDNNAKEEIFILCSKFSS
jgi:hypothetical protein